MAAHDALTVTESPFDGGAVVRCAGEIDLTNCERIVEAVMSALDSGPTGLVLDMSEVTFLDSSGIRCLLIAEKSCHERRIPLELISSEPVQRVLDLVGLWFPTDREPA